MRRPSFFQILGIGKNPGLSEFLQDKQALSRSIYHLEGPGFWVLPAGSTPGNAMELLQSGRITSLVSQLAEWFEWVIIDSPPVLPFADTSVWARLADGVLLVTRQGTTEKRRLQRGLDAIQPNKLLGAVLNCSQNSSNADYYYRKPTV
jgi:Mrp family chromosome partitioning ATPase